MRALSAVIVFTALLALTAAWPQPTGSDRKVVDRMLQYLDQARINKEYAAPSEIPQELHGYQENYIKQAVPSELPQASQDHRQNAFKEESALNTAQSQTSSIALESVIEQGLLPSGFQHISSLNMAIPDRTCPANLKLTKSGPLRVCGKTTNGPGCDSVVIHTYGKKYQNVCGRVRGYQYTSTDAFRRFGGTYATIDDPYVDGVSITYGYPRKHVWTFASGIVQYAQRDDLKHVTCPAVGGTLQPEFVANNYFCSSGNPAQGWFGILYDTPLWSSPAGNCQGSECHGDPLLFCVKLPEPTTDDLELRICTDQHLADEDVRIESFDFFIK